MCSAAELKQQLDVAHSLIQDLSDELAIAHKDLLKMRRDRDHANEWLEAEYQRCLYLIDKHGLHDENGVYEFPKEAGEDVHYNIRFFHGPEAMRQEDHRDDDDDD